MPDLTTRIVDALGRPSYSPLKPKMLAKRMNVGDDEYPEFRRTLRQLVHDGRVEVGRNNTLRLADKHGSTVGTYRRTTSGRGFVRPDMKPGEVPHPDIMIREGRELDAANGDRVLVKMTKRPEQDGQPPRRGGADSGAEHPHVRRHLLRAGRRGVRAGGRHRLRAFCVGRRPRRERGEAARQSADRPAQVPHRRRPRRGCHHRSVRPAHQAGRRSAHGHSRLRHPGRVRRTRAGGGAGAGRSVQRSRPVQPHLLHRRNGRHHRPGGREGLRRRGERDRGRRHRAHDPDGSHRRRVALLQAGRCAGH